MTARLDREILPFIEKPSRYLGNEVNSVHKERGAVDVRLALAFPDLYDLGLGNLGLHILYAVVNALPWAWAERVYAPGLDLEQALRDKGLPLFALESRDALSAFDGVGFTLQSELTYTNILNMLDLGGVPVRAKDRGDGDPLVFAGGPAVFNPEPLAYFIDFFVIGDGEDAIREIAEALRATKGQPRAARLDAIAALEGVYVPSRYPMITTPEGRVLPDPAAPKVRKRITRDLNGATYPVNYIVPFAKQVHDRLNLEVLRGCTQGCRFCQAGMTTRPVRERSLSNLDTLLQRLVDATGYEEVSLVSLSTCDYSQVRQLVQQTVARARPQQVAVSLPSLRLDSYSVELSDMVAEGRKTGITFAPEAASPRLRALINKWIPDEELLSMSSEVYARGWELVKLYFMIGFPTERDDDILAIADLAKRTLFEGRRRNGKAKVNLGVSTLVPKPFTPLQWAAMIPPEETLRRQQVLFDAIRDVRAIKFGRHQPEETWLEGLISRADRRVGDLIEAAWRKGCRFDAWREHLSIDKWREAVAEVGFDVEDALRQRATDEILPWDHIDVLIPKAWFVADWERAMQLQHAEDCRHRRCNRCGVIDRERELCAAMLRDHVDGRKTEDAWVARHQGPDGRVQGALPHVPAAPPKARVWIRIGRTDSARFLGHLEATNAWIRALRRARVPIAWTVGFHPHARVAFNTAVPVGEESLGDWMDVDLTEAMEPALLVERLRATLPAGFHAIHAESVPLSAPSLMSVCRGAKYTVWLPGASVADLRQRAAELLAAEQIPVTRWGKVKGTKREITVDVRPMLQDIVVRDGDPPEVELDLLDLGRKPGKPREILEMFGFDPLMIRVLKRESLLLPPERWSEAGIYSDTPSSNDSADESA